MKKVEEIVGLDTKAPKVVVQQAADTTQDDSYLARRAGMETVQTSMRGLLNLKDEVPSRKTLLGE